MKQLVVAVVVAILLSSVPAERVSEEPKIELELARGPEVIRVVQNNDEIPQIVPTKDKKPPKPKPKPPQINSKVIKQPRHYNIPTSTLTSPKIKSIVSKYFPAGQVAMAMNVIDRESGFDPTARNPSSGCRGLFQIGERTWYGYTNQSYSNAYNPTINIKIASKIWRARGWYDPWLKWW